MAKETVAYSTMVDHSTRLRNVTQKRTSPLLPYQLGFLEKGMYLNIAPSSEFISFNLTL